jgi:multiple sugar transport system substrate-binding protein
MTEKKDDAKKDKLISRRQFLRGAGMTGAGLAAAACAPQIVEVEKEVAVEKIVEVEKVVTAVPEVAKKTGELSILRWNHFVPAADVWFDEYAAEWGAANGVKVTVDGIHQSDMPARGSSELAAQKGHDIFEWNFGTGSPFLWKEHCVSLTDLVKDIEGSIGSYSAIGNQSGYDAEQDNWFALPSYYIRFPSMFRKDLWSGVGFPDGPDTWDDVLSGGTELKAGGNPIGIGLYNGLDPNATWRGLLWSYGGALQDADGNPALDSPETLAAIEMAVKLYQNAMTEEVLAWDDAGNNRFLGSGIGSYIANPISAYRSIQADNPELFANVFLRSAPAGPAARLMAAVSFAYTIWKFSPNQVNALQFLRDWADNFESHFVASSGYNHPQNDSFMASPWPVLAEDPKLAFLEQANDWSVSFGHPGANTASVGEVLGSYHIPTMMANACTGKMTAREALDDCAAKVDAIYSRWASLRPTKLFRV